jgi:hypothetical protein
MNNLTAIKPDILPKIKAMALPVAGQNIAVGLSAEKVQELFEQRFGKDRATRTRKQWKALVKQYGIRKVSEIDGMTEKEVKAKCKNT